MQRKNRLTKGGRPRSHQGLRSRRHQLMGVSGHPSREHTLIVVIGWFVKPSGGWGAAARQPSRLGTKQVPSWSRIDDRRPFSHQKEILLANKGVSIYDIRIED